MADVLRADIVGHDMGASAALRSYGREADVAAVTTRRLAEAQDAQRRAAATSAAATIASAKADKILKDASDDAIRATVEQRIATEKLAASSKKAAGASGIGALIGGGGIAGGGMGALIGAGAALSPVIATLGVGLGGLAAAAYGVARPIEKAAKASGGLQANMAKLNPEQRRVAQGILALGKQFGAFEKQMQPEVLGLFNDGLRLAGHLLADVRPVAAATGKALHGVLGQIDAEFASGEWQSFFKFMASTAAPDVKLLGGVFRDLLADLPPLARDLQPVAVQILNVADAAAKLIHVSETGQGAHQGGLFGSLFGAADIYRRVATDISSAAKAADKWTVSVTNHLPGGRALNDQLTQAQRGFTGAGSAAMRMGTVTGDLIHPLGAAAAQTGIFAHQAGLSAAAAKAEAHQLNILAGAYESALTPLENYISATITQRNDLKALRTALRDSGGAIGYKTQKERDSFAAAQTYITDTLKQGNAALSAHKGIDQQIKSIQNALPQLEHVKGKTADYKAELDLLKKILDKLRQEKLIQEQVRVTGKGSWSVVGVGPFAGKPTGFAGGTGGAPPGWAWVGEKGPELVHMRGGETVIPNHEIPGFASGTGVVPSYAGSPAGLPGWTQRDRDATVRAITVGIASSMAAAFKSAVASMGAVGGSGGPASGAVRALQQYAASLFRFYGWGGNQLGPLIALWNGESGWNPLARNPSSGAFGIPQALPPGKMGALAASGNAAAQIRWGEGYIHSVYGTPANAYGTWLSRSPHWYGDGLRGGVFRQPTLIGVGDRPGGEVVDVRPAGRSGSGALVHVEQMVVQDATDAELVAHRLNFAITAAGLGS